ncbi:MAG: protein kinase [Lentisphaeria bacterium]|jgi:DNA-binding response OmpR family regulator|nr:protein kinase [Lentisphaeria bacterium]
MSRDSIRILIAEDARAPESVLADILRQAGYEHVEVVESQDAALQALDISTSGNGRYVTGKAKQLPTVAITHLSLSAADNRDLCGVIKAAYGRCLPIIMVLGDDSVDAHVRMIDAGADAFVVEPVLPNKLLDEMSRLLGSTAATAAVGTESQINVALPTQAAAPEIGDEIDGYRIVELLSWAGRIYVYRVEDHAGRTFAMKMLNTSGDAEERILLRFEREIDIMSSIDHPNVVRFIDRGSYADNSYILMEFVMGRHLEDLLAEHPGGFDFATVHTVATGLVQALESVHEMGIIHRDIKLRNVFLTDDNEVKVGDFGIAVRIGETRFTSIGYCVGTPLYMAPEQARGQDATPETDIYSFGGTLYHLITGQPPFTAKNALEMIQRHLNDDVPPPLAHWRPAVGRSWDVLIVDRCMATEPRNRPGSMAEVAAILAHLKADRF